MFDDLNVEFGDLVNVKKAAAAYIADGLQSSDRAAVYSISGQTALDFTDDKTKLQEAVSKLKARPMYQHVGRQCPDISYYMADLIVNKNDQQALQAATQETLACMLMSTNQVSVAQQSAQSAARQELTVGEQGTRVTLAAIKSVIRRMATKPGQRLVVLASPGFLARTGEATNDKAQILDLAASMNVIISSLNARGLFTTEMDASQSGAYSQGNQQAISTV